MQKNSVYPRLLLRTEYKWPVLLPISDNALETTAAAFDGPPEKQVEALEFNSKGLSHTTHPADRVRELEDHCEALENALAEFREMRF